MQIGVDIIVEAKDYPMIDFIYKRLHSFRYAWQGLSLAARYHHNFLIHSTISLVVLGSALFIGVSSLELAILICIILLGLVTELVNSALEHLASGVSEEWRVEIKRAKDIAAAAMLLVSIGAVIIAFIIFRPYFLR